MATRCWAKQLPIVAMRSVRGDPEPRPDDRVELTGGSPGDRPVPQLVVGDVLVGVARRSSGLRRLTGAAQHFREERGVDELRVVHAVRVGVCRGSNRAND